MNQLPAPFCAVSLTALHRARAMWLVRINQIAFALRRIHPRMDGSHGLERAPVSHAAATAWMNQLRVPALAVSLTVQHHERVMRTGKD